MKEKALAQNCTIPIIPINTARTCHPRRHHQSRAVHAPRRHGPHARGGDGRRESSARRALRRPRTRAAPDALLAQTRSELWSRAQHRLNDRLNLQPDTPHRETGLAGQVGLEPRSRLRIPRAAAQTRTVSGVVPLAKLTQVVTESQTHGSHADSRVRVLRGQPASRGLCAQISECRAKRRRTAAFRKYALSPCAEFGNGSGHSCFTMPFSGIPREQERTDLIAYLETLKCRDERKYFARRVLRPLQPAEVRTAWCEPAHAWRSPDADGVEAHGTPPRHTRCPDEHAMLCSREFQYRKRNPAVQARLLFTKKLFDNPPLNSVCMRPT
jgi:hypothetical protein